MKPNLSQIFSPSLLPVLFALAHLSNCEQQQQTLLTLFYKSFTNPLLQVKYNFDVKVNRGNELEPVQVKNPPEDIRWPALTCDPKNAQKEPKALFTLVMVDPDVPSAENPSKGEVLHWMVVNLAAQNCETSSSLDVKNGQTIVSYLSPNPTEGSGLHRYLILLYKQSGFLSQTRIDLQNPQISARNRTNFSVAAFAAGHALNLVAGNFFTAQADDYSRGVTSLQVISGMENAHIVPNLIDAAPKTAAMIFYQESKTFVLGGNELTPREARAEPLVKWKLEPNSTYCIVFGDLDPQGRSNLQNPTESTEFLHWLLVDIPANGNLAAGKTLAQYIGPGPSRGSGLHRYVYFVFKQSSSIRYSSGVTIISNRTTVGRANFNLRRFVRENGLWSIPVAGNYFLAQYDDYVPTLMEQLGQTRT